MIRYREFCKRYGRHAAVDHLTLDVPRGAVVALLGPNGSGKTTTIKAAAGLIHPTSGDVVLGPASGPATDAASRRLCSFLPQRVSFPGVLSGRDVIEFYRRVRAAPLEASDRVLRLAALNGASGRPVSTYSGGMLQRLGLAVATVADTAILLLDEPSASLDPDGLCALYGLIDERRRQGTTIFFSSHQLGDVERLADHIAVLVQGRLVAQLTARELADRLADRGVMRVRLRSLVPGLIERIREVAPRALPFDDELIVPGAAAMRPAVLDAIRAAGGEVCGLTAREGRLDELYSQLVEQHS
jgi:Cu-processing system ATP-binding protein